MPEWRQTSRSFPWQPSQPVYDFATDCSTQSQPAVAFDTNDTAYVVWIDGRGSSPSLYWATQPNGGAWSANLAIPAAMGSVSASDPPSLAIDAQRRLYVLWIDLRNGNRDVYFAARSAAGAWSAAERVNDDATVVDQRHPSLAVDNAGNAYAVWQDPRNGDDDVYFAYRPAGGAWSANSRVNNDVGTAGQAKPDIAVDGQGNGYVAWSRNTTVGRIIEFAIRPHGGSWGAAETVSGSGAGVFYDEPAIAADSAGNAALAWHYRYMDRTTVVTAYRRVGGGWGGSYPEPFAFAPDVTMDDAGKAHIVYIGERNPNRIPHIYGSIIPPGGGAWTAEQVSDGRFDEALGSPAIAVSATGRQVAVWGGREDVFSATRQPGGGWSESQPVVDETCSTLADRPDLAVDAAGNSFAVWQDERSGQSEIYFAYRPVSGDWGAPALIGGTGSGDRRSPAIVVDALGNATALWSEWRNRSYDLYACTRSAGGSWSAPALVASQAGHWLRNPDIAAGPASVLVAVWEQVTPDHPEDTTLAFATKHVGGAWSAAAEIPGAAGSTPSLAVDASGTAYLAWKGLSPDIYFSIRPAGGAWTSKETVDDGSAETPVGNPAVAANPAANVVVVWQDSRSSSAGWDIYAADRTATGQWSDNVRVDDDSGSANQVMPAVAMDPAGNAYALWADNRSGDSDVEFAYRPAGGVWASNLPVDDDPGFAEQDRAVIAVDAAGNAHTLWLDQRTGNVRLLSSQARHQDVAMPMRRFMPLIE